MSSDSSSRLPPEHLRVRSILIDVAIVFGATFVGGFIGGFVNGAAGFPLHPLAVAAGANLICATLAFGLVGCRAPTGNRWAHLACVALGTWFTGLLNVWLFDFPPMMWFIGAPLIVVLMAIGGALSMLVKP